MGDRFVSFLAEAKQRQDGCTWTPVHPGDWKKLSPPDSTTLAKITETHRKERALVGPFLGNLEKFAPAYPGGYVGSVHWRTLSTPPGFL